MLLQLMVTMLSTHHEIHYSQRAYSLVILSPYRCNQEPELNISSSDSQTVANDYSSSLSTVKRHSRASSLPGENKSETASSSQQAPDYQQRSVKYLL